MSDEVLSHIRRPALPWRDSGLTECGHRVADVAAAIVLSEAQELIKRHGKQRAAFLLCMTCVERVRYSPFGREREYPLWNELQREGHSARGAAGVELDLAAIVQLIALHPEEFTRIRADIESGALTTVADLRKRREKGRPA